MTDDLGSVATPHQLCSICQQIAASYTPDDSWQRESFFNSKIWHETELSPFEESFYKRLPDICLYWLSRKPLKHHRDFDCLRRSAEGGCHLCALFVGSKRCGKIQANMDKDGPPTEKQLYVAPISFQKALSPLWPCTSRKYCSCMLVSLFDICVTEATSSDAALASVRIHQHPQHRALEKGISSDCSYNLPKMDSEQSIESRYMWCESTGSREGSRMISKWLQRCTAHHKECKNNHGKSRPTRLLDLEVNPESVRIVSGNDLGSQHYATLSYSWGRASSVSLRHDNYQELLSGIRVETLPRTIREAIEVCRRLSMRYLWVDALCIMQENDKDFAEEISRMGSIYAGSFFTIAAADSRDCESGCFRDRSPLYRESCEIWEDERRLVFFSQNSVIPRCTPDDRWKKNSALDSRAWVYQERMMSPRTVHFCFDEIVWECRESSACQRCESTESIHSVYPLYTPSSKRSFIELQDKRTHDSDTSEFQSIWNSILPQYSKTLLSNDDDRLSALAGIAEFPLQKLGYRASFGMWHPFFLDELIWVVDAARNGPFKDYNTLRSFPSWSWVGIKGPFRNISQHIEFSDQKPLFTAALELPPATPFGQMSMLYKQFPQSVSCRARGWIISCRQMIYLRRSNPHSYICRWTLWPVGREVSAEILSDQELSWKVYPNLGGHDSSVDIETRLLLGEASANVDAALDKVLFIPDTKPEGPRNLFCFLLKRVFYNENRPYEELRDFGLVLEQVEQERNRFKRVGLCTERVVCTNSGAAGSYSPGAYLPLPTTCALNDKSNLLEAMSDRFTLFHGQSSDVEEIEIV